MNLRATGAIVLLRIGPVRVTAESPASALIIDAVSPVVCLIKSLMRRATLTPSGSLHAFSVTSRYASSSERPSTSGVTLSKISKT